MTVSGQSARILSFRVTEAEFLALKERAKPVSGGQYVRAEVRRLLGSPAEGSELRLRLSPELAGWLTEWAGRLGFGSPEDYLVAQLEKARVRTLVRAEAPS